MDIVLRGPNLAELRRKLGSKDTGVTFGDDRPNIIYTVDGLAAVGCWDMPINIPSITGNVASVWLVNGDAIEDDEKHRERWNYAALISMTATGRFRVAALVSAKDSNDTSLSFGMHNLIGFGQGAQADIKRGPLMS